MRVVAFNLLAVLIMEDTKKERLELAGSPVSSLICCLCYIPCFFSTTTEVRRALSFQQYAGINVKILYFFHDCFFVQFFGVTNISIE